MEFFYRLFDLYCVETGQQFHPDIRTSNTVSRALRELKQNIRVQL